MVNDIVAAGTSTFNLKHDSASDDPLGSTDINDKLVIYRGVLVKLFAFVVVAAVYPYIYLHLHTVICWLIPCEWGAITLIFVASTILKVVFRYNQRVELLVRVIPILLLFTITSLRTTMPGATTFGTSHSSFFLGTFSLFGSRRNYRLVEYTYLLKYLDWTLIVDADYVALLPCISLVSICVHFSFRLACTWGTSEDCNQRLLWLRVLLLPLMYNQIHNK